MTILGQTWIIDEILPKHGIAICDFDGASYGLEYVSMQVGDRVCRLALSLGVAIDA